MAREYSAFGLVSLPRVDANGAIALAKSVESAAAEQSNLEAPLTTTLGSIASKREALQAAKGAGQSPPTVQVADRSEDDAMYSLLLAWARLAPYLPEGKTAQGLLDRLFGDGVAFVNYKVEKEWAVVDSMLKAITEENLDPALASLGAAPMLAHLKKVHAEYGAVIGTTKAEPEPLEIGEKRDALLDAIRVFVIRVAGTVEPGDKVTETRASALLRPIAEWRTDKPQSKDKSGATPPPASP